MAESALEVMKLPLDALLDEYDRAKRVYDDFLFEAYTSGQGTKWSEEQKKLSARIKTRRAGHLDPDTYRWVIRARFGSILD